MARLSNEVVGTLLDAMNRTVTSYPADVQRTGKDLDSLVAGTAFFAGGTGLWRGQVSGGPLPLHFPEKPVMFVAHHFGNPASLQEAISLKGEADATFATLWNNLLGFLSHAGPLDPARCFFTNALMGLKPDGRSGPMPQCPGYKEQCLHFLLLQVRIVDPQVVVTLGNDAEGAWCAAKGLHPSLKAVRSVKVMHPSARPKDQKPSRELWLQKQGTAIRQAIHSS